MGRPLTTPRASPSRAGLAHWKALPLKQREMPGHYFGAAIAKDNVSKDAEIVGIDSDNPPQTSERIK